MGTRGLKGFVVNGEVKACYNHDDSYPSGLGTEVCEWLAEEIGFGREDEIRKMAADLRTVDEWDNEVTYSSAGLGEILDSGIIPDGADFAADSLFCEWAYLVNFDERVVEVYQGFARSPHSDGRFASETANDSDFYPIRLVATYGFDVLPDKAELLEFGSTREGAVEV